MVVWFMSAYDQPLGKSSRTYDYAVQLSRMGHEVIMFTNSYCHWTHVDILNHDETHRVEMVNGIKVIWLKTFKYNGNGLKRGLNMLSNMLRSLKVEKLIYHKPDVVIGPSVPIGTGLVALRIAKKYKAAFVYEVRDVWPIALVDDGGLSKNSPIYFIFRFIEKILYKECNKISSTVPFLHQHVEDSGADPDKIVWLPNGVDFERFSNCDYYNGGSKNNINVMYIGGFGQAHDVITLVKCALLFHLVDDKRFNFIIIGDGPKKEECIQFANQHALSNVEFRNSIDKSEIPTEQMDADILVACVLDSEIYRFGVNLNKIYDYMASARPVILAANVPNNPILDANSGYAIKPNNPRLMYEALSEYIALSSSDRKKLGINGAKYVQAKFDIKNLAIRMNSMLTKCVTIKENM